MSSSGLGFYYLYVQPLTCPSLNLCAAETLMAHTDTRENILWSELEQRGLHATLALTLSLCPVARQPAMARDIDSPCSPPALPPPPQVLPNRQSWLDVDRWWCGDIIWKHVNPHVQGALLREDSRDASKDRPLSSSSRSRGLVLQGKFSSEIYCLFLSIPST